MSIVDYLKDKFNNETKDPLYSMINSKQIDNLAKTILMRLYEEYKEYEYDNIRPIQRLQMYYLVNQPFNALQLLGLSSAFKDLNSEVFGKYITEQDIIDAGNWALKNNLNDDHIRLRLNIIAEANKTNIISKKDVIDFIDKNYSKEDLRKTLFYIKSSNFPLDTKKLQSLLNLEKAKSQGVFSNYISWTDVLDAGNWMLKHDLGEENAKLRLDIIAEAKRTQIIDQKELAKALDEYTSVNDLKNILYCIKISNAPLDAEKLQGMLISHKKNSNKEYNQDILDMIDSIVNNVIGDEKKQTEKSKTKGAKNQNTLSI